MNTEYLRYFELAYMEGNFSAAARRVPVSPQGLTKAIHTLERDLGVQLFSIDDATGTPVPTEYAHELFQFTQVFDSNMHLLRGAFDTIRGSQRYTIRLGCSLGVLGALGSSFLTRFQETQPNVEFEYWEAPDALVAQSLEKGECDLALLVGDTPEGMRCEELYRCRQYFWVKAEDALAEKDSVAMDDLEGLDVAIPGAGFDCHRRLLADAARAGVNLRSVIQMSEIFQLYEFAASGKGLGFTVEHLVNLPVFVRDSRVVPLPFKGNEWHFGIACLNTHALDDAERAFWTYCKTTVREMQGAQ